MKLTPAECALQALGGVSAVARILKLNKSTVCRWMIGVHDGRPPRRRSGVVPMRHVPALAREAARRDSALTLEDLVFGRERPAQGVVIVRNGRRVDTRQRDLNALKAGSLAD